MDGTSKCRSNNAKRNPDTRSPRERKATQDRTGRKRKEKGRVHDQTERQRNQNLENLSDDEVSEPVQKLEDPEESEV